MKAKNSSFQKMGLDQRVCNAIPYQNPTPIQHEAIPNILRNKNIIGISCTGSGKTFAYLIPVLHKVLLGQKALVLVPTCDLVHQVAGSLKALSRRMCVKAVALHGGKDASLEKYDIIISTVGILVHKNIHLDVDVLVVDEVDRIFEEVGMRNDFLSLEKMLKSVRQNLYFSATVPENMIELVSDFQLVVAETELSASLTHYFFYVPSSLKNEVLLFLVSKVSSKTIIFTSTKHSVDMVSKILSEFNVRPVYSSMDKSLRKRNMQDFIKGTSRILVVTDLATRGLHIPSLDVAINYDMCDKKTFLHRVGRVARGGRVGVQYSLVTFKDALFFFSIRDAYLPKMEIGTIPYKYLQEFSSLLYAEDLEGLERVVENSRNKALKFTKKDQWIKGYSKEIQNIKTHTFFGNDQEVLEKENILEYLKRKHNSDEVKSNRPEDSFRGRFFIPYRKEGARKGLKPTSVSETRLENRDIQHSSTPINERKA